jgi:hypothetical protein
LCGVAAYFLSSSALKDWLGGRVVMQRTANPWTPVRFRPQPPVKSYHTRIAQVAKFGRRKGLKIPRGQPRASSSLAPGTNFLNIIKQLGKIKLSEIDQILTGAK